MSGNPAFQSNAFQNNAFQAAPIVIASTVTLQLPVDYYMEDLPQYRATGRTFEKVRGKAGENVVMAGGKAGRLAGPAPSMKTTTNKRGYD